MTRSSEHADALRKAGGQAVVCDAFDPEGVKAAVAKTKRHLGWKPRFPSWRQGFREALG
jgi:hypothetical protein